MSSLFPFPVPQPVTEGATSKAAGRPRERGPGREVTVLAPSWLAKQEASHPPPKRSSKAVPTQKPDDVFVNVNTPTPGLPPPHPNAFGDVELVCRSHDRRLREDNLGLNPNRFATMINGRPWAGIVMSHDKAPPWEWFNTVGEALFPIQFVVLPGITANSAEGPHVQPQHACVNWFKASLKNYPPYGPRRVGTPSARIPPPSPSPQKTRLPVQSASLCGEARMASGHGLHFRRAGRCLHEGGG